jgi:hypothetical protein
LDSIWARVLKNAFMPLFLEPFDYVAGNPPWINWESLPAGYRAATEDLWRYYGLVATKGKDSEQFELGKQKRDLSTLMTCVATDRYLKANGKLAFLITQSVWKSGASSTFRLFKLPGPVPLRVLHVDDLSSLQVFEGASTRTSVFVLQKGQPTRYPVSYTFWQKTGPGQLDYDSTLEEALAQTKRLNFQAAPVDAAVPTSAWLTARRKALDAVRKVLGRSDYTARAGTVTWANGIYWVEVVAERPDGLAVVRNITEGTKLEVASVTAPLEPDLLYPLLRERDVHRWQAKPSAYIILPHTPETLWQAISEEELQRHYPKTWVYLCQFRETLLQRSGYRLLRPGHPFYILSNVNEATFAPCKVVWPNMGNRLDAAVVSVHQGKPIVPQHIVTVLSLESPEEAHYVAAVVNSLPFQFSAHSYSSGGKSFATPQILENLRVPRYDPVNPVHQRLAALSQQAHNLDPAAHTGDKTAQSQLRQVEDQVDQATAELWGLTKEELREIQEGLKELE